jgi:hypothetical protein
MRALSISTGFGLAAITLLVVTGCGKSKTNPPTTGQATAPPAHHHHHHGSQRGVNGGRIIGMDIESLHAEITHDDNAKRVGIYILGDDAATATPIEAKSVTINAVIDDKASQFELPAAARPGDAVGKSSYFELISEPLFEIVTGKSQSPGNEVELRVAIDGKTHIGEISTEPYDTDTYVAAHGDAADALLWIKESVEDGYKVSLGHHGVQLLAGGKVEPAVQITRDGKPVADAKVFNALFDSDGKTAFAEEVATVYEPPTSDEPSHYAQGQLKIPPGTRQAIIRYRIVFPEGKGERTYDVPVTVK